MEIKVQLNNLRIATRKTRQVADLIRGKNVLDARAVLEFTTKRAAEPMLKLLNSAAASALQQLQLTDSNLTIQRVTVDEGPTLKRSHPMSRGRAYPIMKRTSHMTKTMATVIKKSPVSTASRLVLYHDGKKTFLAARNIAKTGVLETRNLNVSDLLNYKYVLVSKDGIKEIEKTFIKK